MRFAVALAVVTLFGCVSFSTRSVTSSLQENEPPASIARAFDDAADIVDRYGNEIVDAVAAYSLDPDGTLYEMHSPQTELPRLPSPKS